MGDHDSIFKRAFSVPAHAAGELRSVLPEAISASLDMTTLRLEPASFVDEELEHRHADLLFSVSLAGNPGLIYFLFEHQEAPDPLMPWRVLTYHHRIWSALLRETPRVTLPPIVTIIVHHGSAGWTSPRTFQEIVDGLAEVPALRRFVPDFELVIDDLAAATDETLRRRPLAPFPKVALWLLRDGRRVEAFLEHLEAWADELERLVTGEAGADDYVTVLRYIWRVVGADADVILRRRIIENAPTFGEGMPSIEEALIERGRREGHVAGLRAALATVVEARFGSYDDDVRRRIAEATGEELERWIARVAVATRVEHVFDPS